MTILLILNIIMIIIIIIATIFIYNIVNVFNELLVRYVELNAEHFKNFKHLVYKTNELATQLKSIHKIPNSIKTEVRKLSIVVERLENKVNKNNKRS